MAKFLEKEGTYTVTIHGAHWTKLQAKDGDERRMAAVLPGFVEVDGVEQMINAELNFTRALIGKGQNAGRSMADVNMETLIALGMAEDVNGLINPARLSEELEGKQAKFVCEFEEYQGKSRLKVKFVNPPGRPDLDVAEAAAIFAELLQSRPAATERGAKSTAITSRPVAAGVVAAKMDDIPF